MTIHHLPEPRGAAPVPRPRIFISHSTRAKPGQVCCRCLDARDALVQQLEAEGFEAVYDKDFLRSGDAWQQEIAIELHGSQATVLLLSRHALDSANVGYEASIADGRRRADARYRFLALKLPDVQRAELAESALKAIHIGEVDMCDWADDEIVGNRLPDKLRTDLAQIRLWHLDRSSPTRKAVTYALAEAYEDRLRAAADLLGVCERLDREVLRERLSEALLIERAPAPRHEPDPLVRALGELLPVLRPEPAGTVADLSVVYARVPTVVAAQLGALRLRESGRIAVLAATRGGTLRAYLLRASGHPRPWPHLEVTVPAGAEMAAGLIAAIRDRVAGYLDYDGYHDPELEGEAGFRDVIEAHAQETGPIVVVIRHLPDAALVRELRAAFPLLLLLFVTDRAGACGSVEVTELAPLTPAGEGELKRTHGRAMQLAGHPQPPNPPWRPA
ncbi:toll/interleukin-1 receptor domain-containing protein [Embleya scabrispora]|uniref:toll/interleukin-1 receptor domain-containing protein n=1 Tax=Embleya scabrispora TaxID=159449 RepID=UPI00038096D1|nr:toll/interleukin-1 receptor domain-containing protein [Embleya scabrispora]MYS84173.1 TIR domain-containing protein [Streptomyces sp. SID5474]